MNNDDPANRETLIHNLNARGIPAYEYHSGGGIMHVAVNLIDDAETEDLLQIATGSAETCCDLGLMGWRDGGSWEGADWIPIASMQEAEEHIHLLWEDREKLCARFLGGTLSDSLDQEHGGTPSPS